MCGAGLLLLGLLRGVGDDARACLTRDHHDFVVEDGRQGNLTDEHLQMVAGCGGFAAQSVGSGGR